MALVEGLPHVPAQLRPSSASGADAGADAGAGRRRRRRRRRERRRRRRDPAGAGAETQTRPIFSQLVARRRNRAALTIQLAQFQRSRARPGAGARAAAQAQGDRVHRGRARLPRPARPQAARRRIAELGERRRLFGLVSKIQALLPKIGGAPARRAPPPPSSGSHPASAAQEASNAAAVSVGAFVRAYLAPRQAAARWRDARRRYRDRVLAAPRIQGCARMYIARRGGDPQEEGSAAPNGAAARRTRRPRASRPRTAACRASTRARQHAVVRMMRVPVAQGDGGGGGA